MSRGVFLFDKDYSLQDTIPADRLTENYMDAELNGLITGTFATTDIIDMDNYYYYGVKDGSDFLMFKIRSVVKERDTIRVNGIHIMYDELQGHVIRDLRPRNQLVNTTLTSLLKDTDWSVGTVVASDKVNASFYHQSVLSALYEMCASATVEFRPRVSYSKGKIVGKYIDIYDRLSMDAGKIFKYGDNLLKVVAETNTDELFTAFIGRGKGEQLFDENGQPTGGYSRKIKFTDIDYQAEKDGIKVHSPKGQDYIEIKEATALYGYPTGQPRTAVIDFESIEDVGVLADATFEYALENCRPKVQLKASGLAYDKVELGETVTIIGQMDIRYKTRVFKIKKDFLKEQVVSFEFGDKVVKSMSDRIKAAQFSEKEREITEQNYIKAMIAMVEDSYFNEDGYQYDLKADNEYDLPAGLYSFNKPIDQDPDKVIYLGAGKLMIANSKKADGSWDFSVAIDGDAVNANVIRAGLLKGGKVEWDLQNGTFLIGNNTKDFNFYWDGQKLWLRNVDIDLKNYDEFKALNNGIEETQRVLREHKIEQGNLSTTITNLDTKIQQQIRETNNTFERAIKDPRTGLEARMTQTEKGFDNVVKKNGVISAINQSPENVSIQANKINLKGATIVDGVFETKTKDRTIRLHDGKITFKDSSNKMISEIYPFIRNDGGNYLRFDVPSGGGMQFRYAITNGFYNPTFEIGTFKRNSSYNIYGPGATAGSTNEVYTLRAYNVALNEIGIDKFRIRVNNGRELIIQNVEYDMTFKISKDGILFQGDGTSIDLTKSWFQVNGQFK